MSQAALGVTKKECLDGENIFVIRDFCTPQECELFIGQSEQSGYTKDCATAKGRAGAGDDARDSGSLTLNDPSLAASWYERVVQFLPQRIQSRNVVGLNELFRFYRYDPGQKFAPHVDHGFLRENGEQSQLTFMVYLNDEFRGGSTNFYLFNWMPRLSVVPERGMALIFGHRQVHEGAPIETGRKYVLRTDVMYSRG